MEKIRKLGIQAELNEIFSTCVIAAHWLKQKGIERLHPLLPNDAQRDFLDFELTEDLKKVDVKPDWIIDSIANLPGLLNNQQC